MPDFRKRSRNYTRIAKQLIDDIPELNYIYESRVRILCLESELEKKEGNRAILGQCEKVADKYKWAIPYDFMITVFQPNVERLSRKQKRILILHELLHIGILVDGNEERYFIRKHDYEEFALIIRRFGIDWSDDVEA